MPVEVCHHAIITCNFDGVQQRHLSVQRLLKRQERVVSVSLCYLVQISALKLLQAKEEASPPDSPHLRSGTSSFSHISSPASYHFGNSDDEGSDTDSSQWTSDGEVRSSNPASRWLWQAVIPKRVLVVSSWACSSIALPITNHLIFCMGESREFSFPAYLCVIALPVEVSCVRRQEVASNGQGSQATRSEADSDEAIQDVVAVSQEGSLGSLSDSDAGYRRMSRTTCARSTPGIGYAHTISPPWSLHCLFYLPAFQTVFKVSANLK